MPIIEVFAPVSPKDMRAFTKELSSTFSGAIGKPEKICLISFTKVDGFSFGGSDEPGFFVKVSSIGNIDNNSNSNLTAMVTAVIQKHLDVQLERGYFNFSNAEKENVGYMNTTLSNLWENNNKNKI